MLDNKFIGNLIREARKKKGLTQEQLADAIYVKKQAVSQWETGKTRPNMDSFEQLNRVLGINLAVTFGKVRKNEMDIKKLELIYDFDELALTAKSIVKSIETDSVFEKTVATFLEYTLFAVLGYECYYLSFSRKKNPDDTLEWSNVAWDIANLLDDEDSGPIFDGCKYPFNPHMTMMEKKIHYMSFLIGGELFEDFDEDGYREGFIQQVGRYGEACGYDLIKILPQSESDLFSVYKVALLKLSECIGCIE